MFDTTNSKFGIELELTGMTRLQAAKVISGHFGGEISLGNSRLDGLDITASDGRVWSVVRDSSIACQKRTNGHYSFASSDYSVEVVSPILSYHEDIDKLQGLVRKLRKAGGFVNSSCGIHIHLDGAPHTARSIKNFIILVASRNDLFYKAFQIKPDRMQYCKKMDERLVRDITQKKPTTLDEIENIWYANCNERRTLHYNSTRYFFLNLHSLFNGNFTVELRGFNSSLHAGKVRSYIVFALAINHQALIQKNARYVHVQEENERFAMRVYLNRIGFIGDEFKSCREHLYQHLSGNAAWRYGSKEACRSHVHSNRQNESSADTTN